MEYLSDHITASLFKVSLCGPQFFNVLPRIKARNLSAADNSDNSQEPKEEIELNQFNINIRARIVGNCRELLELLPNGADKLLVLP